MFIINLRKMINLLNLVLLLVSWLFIIDFFIIEKKMNKKKKGKKIVYVNSFWKRCTFYFSLSKNIVIMGENFASQLLHLRDRLPQIAPRINLTTGRFWVSIEEFNGCVKQISCDIERIKSFCIFAINNHDRIRQTRLIMHGDIKLFIHFLSYLVENEFVNPKELFETTCGKFQFEFLLLYDLCRE